MTLFGKQLQRINNHFRNIMHFFQAIVSKHTLISLLNKRKQNNEF